MKKKATKKNIKLCLGLVIILILAGTYRFGYLEYTDSEKEIRTENNQLQQRVNELTTMQLSRAEYEQGIADMNKQINAIISKYGPEVTEEALIMLLRNMELETGVKISSASFSAENLLFASQSIETEAGTGVIVYNNLLSNNYQCTYEGLKSMLDYITNYRARMNVDSITVSYNRDTGNLSGSIVLNTYSMLGTGKVYEAPVVGGIDLGIENIFRTTELAPGTVPNTAE